MFRFISEFFKVWENKDICEMVMCRRTNALEPLCQTEGDPEVSKGHEIKVNKLPRCLHWPDWCWVWEGNLYEVWRRYTRVQAEVQICTSLVYFAAVVEDVPVKFESVV